MRGLEETEETKKRCFMDCNTLQDSHVVDTKNTTAVKSITVSLCLLYVKLEYREVKAMQEVWLKQAKRSVKQEHIIHLKQSNSSETDNAEFTHVTVTYYDCWVIMAVVFSKHK